jgi:PAS domain S-box-containing protein
MRIPRAVAASSSLDAAPFGVLWVDGEGHIAYANKQIKTLLGWTQEDLLGKSIPLLASFWSTNDWKNTLWPKAGGGPLADLTGEWHSKTGQQVALSAHIARLQVAGQDIASVYLLPNQVQDTVPTHSSLVTSPQDGLPDFLQALPIGVALVDAALNIQQTNRAFAAIVGKDTGELIQQPIASVLLPSSNEESRWARLPTGGLHNWRFSIRNAQGRVMYLVVSSVQMNAGEEPRYLVVVEDKSESVQLKEMLEQHENSFENIAANTPGMIYTFVMTPEGAASFPYASAGARDIWEIDPAEVRHDATPIVRLIHPDDLGGFQQSVMKSASELSRWDFEGRIVTPSGKLKWFHAASRPVLTESGNIEWGGLLMDITHQKAIEEELKVAKVKAEEAARSKADFLANMSHEIRTPMNGIIGMAELLDKMNLAPKQKHYVETIRSSAESLLTILNDILDISKMEAGKLALSAAPFDFRRVMDDIAMLLGPSAFNKGLELVIRFAPDAPTYVFGDGVRIRQVLTNLIGNSIKFTPEGHVLVNADLVKLDGENATFKISIVDTGIGISEEAITRLFRNFEQAEDSTSRKFGGTGLGLAISRQLVELMGGTIDVESTLGQGSTFFFVLTLPVRDAGVLYDSKSNITDLRVLCVDDHPVSREIFSEIMDSWNVKEHQEADSGQQALQLLREAKQSGRPFSIGLLDYLMPGMDGLLLVQAIRAESEIANLPIVMLSSKIFTEDEQRQFANLGVSTFLQKPIRPSELRQVLIDTVPSNDALDRFESLPISKEKQADTTLQTPSNSQTSQTSDGTTTLKILLAEDNEVNAEIATSMLGDLHCSVEHVVNGIEALEAAKTKQYDVIFMDCQMPEMDGFTAATEIRKVPMTPRPFIIAMTAYAMGGDREKCIAAGMDDYLSKPVTFNAIKATVEKYRNLVRMKNAAPANPPAPESVSVAVSFQPSKPLFDINAALLVTGGRHDVLAKATAIWWKKIPIWMDSIKTGIQTENAALIRDTAHTVKGAAGNVGALSVAEYAAKLECHEELTIAQIATLFDCLVMNIDQLKGAMAKETPLAE